MPNINAISSATSNESAPEQQFSLENTSVPDRFGGGDASSSAVESSTSYYSVSAAKKGAKPNTNLVHKKFSQFCAKYKAGHKLKVSASRKRHESL